MNSIEPIDLRQALSAISTDDDNHLCILHKHLFGADVPATDLIMIPTEPVMAARICNCCAHGLIENEEFRESLIDALTTAHRKRMQKYRV